MIAERVSIAAFESPAYSGFEDWIGRGPFDVEARPHSHDQFAWGIRESRLDDVYFTQLKADPLRICHTNKQVRQRVASRLFVTLQVSGRSTATQHDRTVDLGPGDFTILDSDAPYEIEFHEPAERLILSLPKEIVGGRLPKSGGIAAARFSRSPGIQTVFADFLRSVSAECHAISDRSIGTIINRLTDLLLLVVEENLYADLAPEVTTNKAAIIRSIERFIEVHLADPDLCSTKIAAKHGISERYVQNLFAIKKTSATKYIRDMRLERCREALGNAGSQGRTVSEICLGWGFNDPAYFTRAFKQRFDVPPGVYRTKALAAAN